MALSFGIYANIYKMVDVNLEDLTTAERLIYVYIAAFVMRNGYAPTQEEIILGTGCSEKTWHRTYKKLKGMGLIKAEKRYKMNAEALEIANAALKPVTPREEEEE